MAVFTVRQCDRCKVSFNQEQQDHEGARSYSLVYHPPVVSADFVPETIRMVDLCKGCFEVEQGGLNSNAATTGFRLLKHVEGRA